MPTPAQNTILKALSHWGEREIGDSNTGPQVDKYLAYVGDAPGQPWCAAAASYWIGKTLESMNLPIPFKSGSSSQWYDWGKANGKLLSGPVSGCLALEKGGDTGHCHALIVLWSANGQCLCISGNDDNAVRVDVRDASTLDYVWPYP